MADPTTDPHVSRSVLDVAIGAGGALLGAVFAAGRKSERVADHEKRIKKLEDERHADNVATNARLDSIRAEVRDELKAMRAEVREELRDLKAELREVLRGRIDP